MIKKGLLYFLLLTLAMYGLRSLHYKGLLRTKGYYTKYRTAFFGKYNYDVLFLGSSRIEKHYDTKEFDAATGQNSFNLGLPGATVHEAYVAFKGYLSVNRHPKFVIYEVDFHRMKERSFGLMEFSNFFPFLSNKVLREELNQIDGRMNLFYYNPYHSWPYTGLKNISTSLHGWLNQPMNNDNLYHKGFFKDTITRPLMFIPTVPRFSYMNISERNYLDSLALLCKRNGIHLTFMTSPLFAGGFLDVSNRSQILRQVSNITRIHGLQYFNYSAVTFCNRREYFVDHYHMNYKGTAAFTPLLIHAFNNKIKPLALK